MKRISMHHLHSNLDVKTDKYALVYVLAIGSVLSISVDNSLVCFKCTR